MKVALFTETYLPYINGIVTHVKILKEGLEELGHEVLVVCADVNARHHTIKNGVLHCPAKSFKRFYNYGLAFPLSTSRIRILKEWAPDIIHIHNEFGIGLSGVMIAKELKVPLVYTLHTMYDDYLYYVAPRPLIKLLKKTSHKYAGFLAKSATALTGPSKKVEEFFKECGIEKDVNVIPNPVELDIFEPENISEEKTAAFKDKYNIPADAFLACFCGRLGREKSIDVLLKFWSEVVKPEDNIKLLIIGGGPSHDELQELATSLGLDSVIFTGAIPHDDLPPYYAACDCYVTTSLSDTNSISMLEAMATGLPVLHLYDELNEGQVVTGVNGYTFTDAYELYDNLLHLKNKTPLEWQALNASVRDSVKQSGAANLANYIVDIYNKELISNPKNQKKKKTVAIKQAIKAKIKKK